MTKLNHIFASYRKWFLLSPVIFILMGLFIIPMLWLLRVSFYANEAASGFGISNVTYYVPDTFTFNNYIRFFTDSYFIDTLLVTLKIGGIVTIVTMISSYLFAYYIYRANKHIRLALIVSVLLPKLTNMLVLFYGLQILLGPAGFINQLFMYLGVTGVPLQLTHNLFSVVAGKVLIVMPYAVMVIAATLNSIDKTLIDAAKGLGASDIRAFAEVTFPLSLPGTMVALVITMIWSLGAFVSPYLLGNPDLYTMAVEIQRQTFENVNWAMGATVAYVLVTLIMLLVLAYSILEHKIVHKV